MRFLFWLIIFLVVVVIGEAAYLFLYKIPHSNKTDDQVGSLTPTIAKEQEKAFNPYSLSILQQVHKSDRVESTTEYLLEGTVILIEENGRVRDPNTGEIFSYAHHLVIQDSQKKYPANHYYITSGMRDLVQILDKENTEIGFDSLKIGDKVQIQMKFDLTKDWTDMTQTYKIIRL